MKTLDGTGSAAITLTANNQDITLISNGHGDTLVGGMGNDNFKVLSSTDVVIAQRGALSNTIQSTVSYTASANVQNLVGTGTANIALKGGSGDETIVANQGNDSLYAGSGNDTLTSMTGHADFMFGGTGNDTFIVTSLSDSVTALAGSNINTILASTSYVDQANVQIMTATAAGLTLTGGVTSATLNAYATGSRIVAGTAVDTMVGGTSGINQFVINNAGDVVVAQAGASNEVDSSVSYTAGATVQTVVGTATGITLTGTTGNQSLTSTSGFETLVAGNGNDTLKGGALMVGGSGNDTFVVGSTTSIVEAQAGSNINTVNTSVSYVGPDNVQFLNGTAQKIMLTGGNGPQTLTDTMGDETLVGGAGVDTLIGSSVGGDLFVVNNSADVIEFNNPGTGGNTLNTSVSFSAGSGIGLALATGSADLTLTGTGSGNQEILGNAGHDTLIAGSGNDTLGSGTGAATMIGGTGNDEFIVSHADDVVIAQAGGIDSIQTSISYTASANVQSMVGISSASIELSGSVGNQIITAEFGKDTLVAGSGDDTLVAGAQSTADTMIGGAGNDTFVIDSTADLVIAQGGGSINTVQSSVSYTSGSNIAFLAATGTTAITLTGSTGDQTISGNASHDTLVAGAGNDTLVTGAGGANLVGGAGNETFVVTSAATSISAQSVGNTNTILTAVSFTGAANVQAMTGTGSANLVLTGNAATSELVTANAGNDTLVAGAVIDTLVGGSGNDTFVVNNTSDVVQAQAGSNVNTVQSSVNYTASANVAALSGTGSAGIVLTGGPGDMTITGNGGQDTLVAGAGNDTLVAGTGIDTMIGTMGNDVFVVNNAADVVQAQAGGNLNTVLSSVTYATGDNMQVLMATGAAALKLTGGAQTQTIRANSGADTLVAGSGNVTLVSGTGVDSLVGGTGNDTFIVNNASDIVAAQAGAASNTVETAVSYTSPANVQYLTGEGTAAITLTGGATAQTLTANSGNDTLVSGTGIDTLIGGAGNDTFVVNNAGDVVQAQAGGSNVIQTSVSLTGPANVQRLTGTGSADLALTGNGQGEIVTGNAGHDTLVAGSASDTLVAGTGVATLVGAAGTTFVVNNAADVIQISGGSTDDPVDNVEYSSVSVTAAAGIDRLYGTGLASITLGANSLDDMVTANEALDTLVAGSGNDTLVSSQAFVNTLTGGTGSDTFVVFQSADVIQALAGADNTVVAATSYTASANIETMTAIGDAAVTLTGNGVTTTKLVANDVNTRLNDSTNPATPSKVAVTMIGGLGNNTYAVTNAGDVIVADANALSNVVDTWTGNYVSAAGVTVLNGELSQAAQTLIANDGTEAVNTSTTGNDTVVAGRGSDVVTLNATSGFGDKVVVAAAAGDASDGALTSVELPAAGVAGKANEVLFSEAASNQLWMTQSGNDLLVSVLGTHEQVDLTNWFAGASAGYAGIVASDGKTIGGAQVNALVSAMAAFAPPGAGTTALPATLQSELAPTLAASWH
ncbi:hypothetical protein Bpla01_66320 [Burkholderia plantarii]|nr:hypothetical protein Bpla01_66320 [Burkholderia plantarii]